MHQNIATVAFGFNGSRRHPTERFLFDAFGFDFAVAVDFDDLKQDVSIIEILESLRHSGKLPNAFAHLIDTPALPDDLHRSPVPTICLDIDSFGWPASRLRWAMLFDYVFVWHPSLVPLYKSAGHPNVVALPHAADATLFDENPRMEDRPFEVGWVGVFNYAHYNSRRRIVENLAQNFRMNQVNRRFSKQETAEVYKQSKIVVNVSREDCPQEANMRCYEAMAAGALLITGVPTELTEWGFREHEHFIGWRSESEIPQLVRRYLGNIAESAAIAARGRNLTLKRFTFQRCRDQISSIVFEKQGDFAAPARGWRPDRTRLLYLEHHYRHQLFRPALKQFTRLGAPVAYCKGLPMMLKTIRHSLKACF